MEEIATEAAPLVLKGIGRRFRHRWALRGASLSLERGDVLALMGRNGSGKSTLLRVAAMLLRPSKGTGRVYGWDIARESGYARGMVALLSHDNGLYEDLSAAENLRFVLRMLGRSPSDASILGALERVGLREVAHDRVRTFSSGMQRRLALARLTLHAPALLLLDEPYNSLDSDGVPLINELVEDTRSRGGAALVVVHEVERVRPVATRWARLRDGRIFECADPTEAQEEAASAVEEVA